MRGWTLEERWACLVMVAIVAWACVGMAHCQEKVVHPELMHTGHTVYVTVLKRADQSVVDRQRVDVVIKRECLLADVVIRNCDATVEPPRCKGPVQVNYESSCAELRVTREK